MGRFAETVGDAGIDVRIAAGLQRSPLVCRTRRWLSSVDILGVRTRAVAAPVYPPGRRRIADLLTAIMPLRCAVAPRYSYAALSPGNPLIHPARLFGFANHPRKRRTRFYADWDDEASRLLLDLHVELARVRDALGLSRRWLLTFADRATPPTPARITQEIRGAHALRSIRVPLRMLGGKVVLDASHRFCREDIGEGLEYIHRCAVARGLSIPITSTICRWFHSGAPMATI